jgi:hypothetical protein
MVATSTRNGSSRVSTLIFSTAGSSSPRMARPQRFQDRLDVRAGRSSVPVRPAVATVVASTDGSMTQDSPTFTMVR